MLLQRASARRRLDHWDCALKTEARGAGAEQERTMQGIGEKGFLVVGCLIPILVAAIGALCELARHWLK